MHINNDFKDVITCFNFKHHCGIFIVCKRVKRYSSMLLKSAMN